MSNHNFQVLGFEAEITVVIPNDAEAFLPIVIKNGNLYNPENGFKPIDPKPKQKSLTANQQERAMSIINDAAKWWKPQSVAAPVAEQPTEPAAPIQPTTPQTTLENLIAKSVAELSVNSVMETAQPFIEKYVADNFGILPKTIEVKTETDTKKVTGYTHHEFETVLKLVAADIPVFLTGPAGCGKNVICKQISEALGKEFYFSNAVTQEYKITGFIDANGKYQETQFYKAFTHGGVFMLDEMDASTPEVLVILNAAIANRYFDFPVGRVEAHPDFRIVAAGNTYGTGADIEYTGRFQLDASSLDRFAIIEVSYDNDIELAIAGGDKEVIEFIHAFRSAIAAADIKFTVSYRAIERLVKLKGMFDTQKTIQLAVLRGMEKDDAKMVAKKLPKISNQYIYELKKMLKK